MDLEKSQIVCSSCLMAVVVLVQAGFVFSRTESLTGCTFDVPYELMRNPVPEIIPLLFDVHIHIIALREVANAGGSFGVDVEYGFSIEIVKA